MAQISTKLRGFEGGVTYWCQGCRHAHSILIEGMASPDMPGDRWSWNRDLERPIFSPSVHIWVDEPLNIGNPEALAKDVAECQRRKAAGELDAKIPLRRRTVCHTFIGCNGAQPGEVNFLSDCDHQYKGTVQPLPDLPEHLTDAWHRRQQEPEPTRDPFTWTRKA